MAQSALGTDWEASYMSAPIWRFSLSSGVAGQQNLVGVVMPSVDRVGRHYPLTLVHGAAAAGSAPAAYFSAIPLFERLETLALDCLEDDMSRDSLAQALADIQIPATGETSMCFLGESVFIQGAGTRTPADILAAAHVDQSCSHPCLFGTVVGGSERMMICNGLPGEQEAVGMFHLRSPIWNKARVT